MIEIPAGFTYYGSANNGNQVTLRATSSTAAKPFLILLDRKDPVWNPTSKEYSVPEARVRVLVGTVDSDGNPKAQRLLVDASFRTPIGSDADQASWLAAFKAVINDANFLSSFVQGHELPCCVEVE